MSAKVNEREIYITKVYELEGLYHENLWTRKLMTANVCEHERFMNAKVNATTKFIWARKLRSSKVYEHESLWARKFITTKIYERESLWARKFMSTEVDEREGLWARKLVRPKVYTANVCEHESLYRENVHRESL